MEKISDSDSFSQTSKSSEIKEDTSFIEIRGNRYEIISELGSGNFGTVYSARKITAPESKHSNQERILALKKVQIHRDLPNHKQVISNEITLTKLFLEVYDQDERDGFYYYIMEKVPGQAMPKPDDIVAFIDRNIKLQANKLLLIVKLLKDLKRIHDQGTIHGDIKPENIMLDPEEKEIKLIDFGISRKSNRFSAWHDIPMGGNFFYCPPDILDNLRLKSYDIFSITGVIGIILGYGSSIINDPDRENRLFRLKRYYEANPNERGGKPVISTKYCLDSLLASSTLPKSQVFFIYLFLQWMQNDNPLARPGITTCLDFFTLLKNEQENWQLGQCTPFFMYPQVFLRLDNDQKNDYTTVVREGLAARLAPRRPVETVLEYLDIVKENKLKHLLEHAFAGSPDQLNLSADHFDMKIDDPTLTEIECKEILYGQAYSVQPHFYPTESHDNAYFTRIKDDRIKHALIVTLANRGPIHRSWITPISNDDRALSLYNFFFTYKMPEGVESYENYRQRIATLFLLSTDELEKIIVYPSITSFIINLMTNDCWSKKWANHFENELKDLTTLSRGIEFIQDSQNHQFHWYYETLVKYCLFEPKDFNYLKNSNNDPIQRCKILSHIQVINMMDQLFLTKKLNRGLLDHIFYLPYNNDELNDIIYTPFIEFLIDHNSLAGEYLTRDKARVFKFIENLDLKSDDTKSLLSESKNIYPIIQEIVNFNETTKINLIRSLILKIKKNQLQLPQKITPEDRAEISSQLCGSKGDFIRENHLNSNTSLLKFAAEKEPRVREKKNPNLDLLICTAKVASAPIAISGIIPPVVALAQAKTLSAATAFCVTKFIAAGAGASIALSVAPLTLALVSGALLLGVAFLIARHLETKTRTEEVLDAAYKWQASLSHC